MRKLLSGVVLVPLTLLALGAAATMTTTAETATSR